MSYSVEQQIFINQPLIWEKQMEPVCVKPVIRNSSSGNLRLISFGNTGFELHVLFDKANDVIDFHYLPEGNTSGVSKDAARYATLLGAGLWGSYEFFSNKRLTEQNGISVNKWRSLSAQTNDRLASAIFGLFYRFNVVHLVSREMDDYQISINLKGFSKLNPSEPLLIYLKTLSERAQRESVEVIKSRKPLY